MDRRNFRCYYYPCHDENKLQDCTFCYCFKYPCEDTTKGVYLKNGWWDCSTCTWPHEKERVDEIFKILKNNSK
jgi:Zn-finger protein